MKVEFLRDVELGRAAGVPYTFRKGEVYVCRQGSGFEALYIPLAVYGKEVRIGLPMIAEGDVFKILP